MRFRCISFALIAATALTVTTLTAQKNVPAPRFVVDPSWPKDMPNNWIFGSITGVFVDAKEQIWVTHLPETLTEEETSETQTPPIATCCRSAPTVVVFDQAGTVVNSWGDPTQDIAVYPRNPHGIFVDHKDNVWIGTYMHHRVQKFTRDGKHLMTIGTYDKTGGSNDTTLLGGPAGIWVDPKTNEAFIADGYRNRRVIVFDGDTGKYLRHWGAYGEKPDDTQKPANNPDVPNRQFSTVHGITGSNDGFIYVADRPRQPHPGVRSSRQVHSRTNHCAEDAGIRLGVRAGVVARSRAAVAVSRGRYQPQGVDPAPQ
jgi:hypothetical protein